VELAIERTDWLLSDLCSRPKIVLAPYTKFKRHKKKVADTNQVREIGRARTRHQSNREKKKGRPKTHLCIDVSLQARKRKLEIWHWHNVEFDTYTPTNILKPSATKRKERPRPNKPLDTAKKGKKKKKKMRKIFAFFCCFFFFFFFLVVVGVGVMCEQI
jgi:hypothetical protein